MSRTNSKQILELHMQNYSGRAIAEMLRVSRNTVAKTLDALAKHPIEPDCLESFTEEEIRRTLFPEKYAPRLTVPDLEWVHKELQKPGVTLKLLWKEYQHTCARDGIAGYQYSRFCDLYHNYVQTKGVTAPLMHRPGHEVMVDWAGTAMHLADPLNAKSIPVRVFVGVLPFSMYTFACGFLSFAEEDWITAHIQMYEFFGGVPVMLRCDNTKTAIIHNRKKEDPQVNLAYAEMARHYGGAIIACRPYSPRDKAAVESAVKDVTQQVIAPLRNTTFYELGELNAAMIPYLKAMNESPFQKRAGSRIQIFQEEEFPHLKPLPDKRLFLGKWYFAKVQKNCHVTVQKHYYSVPYKYCGQQAKAYIDDDSVHIYIDRTLVATHPLAGSDTKEKYTTNPEHMPAGHRIYQDWNASKFLNWGANVGPKTREVVRLIIKSYEVEEQAYKTLFALLHLADNKMYVKADLEKACATVLEQTNHPSYRRVEQELKQITKTNPAPAKGNSYAMVRGGNYYGNKQ